VVAVDRNALAAFVSYANKLTNVVHWPYAASAEEAIGECPMDFFDLVITDVDLGLSSPRGFDLVHNLRRKVLRSLLCIHSNRIISVDHKVVVQVEKDAFLPRAMARA
jgi:hypothetical protein